MRKVGDYGRLHGGFKSVLFPRITPHSYTLKIGHLDDSFQPSEGLDNIPRFFYFLTSTISQLLLADIFSVLVNK